MLGKYDSFLLILLFFAVSFTGSYLIKSNAWFDIDLLIYLIEKYKFKVLILVLLLFMMVVSLIALLPSEYHKYMEDPEDFMEFGDFCWFYIELLLNTKVKSGTEQPVVKLSLVKLKLDIVNNIPLVADTPQKSLPPTYFCQFRWPTEVFLFISPSFVVFGNRDKYFSIGSLPFSSYLLFYNLFFHIFNFLQGQNFPV